MQVKIGNTIYNSEDTPIMLILSQEDKDNIGNMVKGSYKYCSFPNYYKPEGIIEFMKTDKINQMELLKDDKNKSDSNNKETVGFLQY